MAGKTRSLVWPILLIVGYVAWLITGDRSTEYRLILLLLATCLFLLRTIFRRRYLAELKRQDEARRADEAWQTEKKFRN